MSYNTVAQFRSFSLTSGSFDAVPDAVVQEYLDVAQSEIDSALVIHHTLPFPSGSVPASVLEAERVICGYRAWMSIGIDPGARSEFLTRRYEEVIGDGRDPTSGWLGQLANGTRALVDPKNGDQEDTAPKPSFVVIGGQSRGWQQGCPGSPYAPGTFVE